VDQVFFFDSTHDVGWKVVLSKGPRFCKMEVEAQFEFIMVAMESNGLKTMQQLI
jgi:hypothetical protein